MSDIVERLCETAGRLITGTMQDGDVPVAMLVEASDEIERLQRRVAALEMVIREEMDPALCDCDVNRMIAESVHEKPLPHPVGGSPK